MMKNNKLRNKNWKFVLLYDYKPLPSTLETGLSPRNMGPCGLVRPWKLKQAN
jgi:hypothetical protein